MVGGEKSQDEEAKKRKQSRRKYADERKKKLAAAAMRDDDLAMLEVYDSIHQDVKQRDKAIDKQRKHVRLWPHMVHLLRRTLVNVVSVEILLSSIASKISNANKARGQ